MWLSSSNLSQLVSKQCLASFRSFSGIPAHLIQSGQRTEEAVLSAREHPASRIILFWYLALAQKQGKLPVPVLLVTTNATRQKMLEEEEEKFPEIRKKKKGGSAHVFAFILKQ